MMQTHIDVDYMTQTMYLAVELKKIFQKDVPNCRVNKDISTSGFQITNFCVYFFSK